MFITFFLKSTAVCVSTSIVIQAYVCGLGWHQPQHQSLMTLLMLAKELKLQFLDGADAPGKRLVVIPLKLQKFGYNSVARTSTRQNRRHSHQRKPLPLYNGSILDEDFPRFVYDCRDTLKEILFCLSRTDWSGEVNTISAFSISYSGQMLI